LPLEPDSDPLLDPKLEPEEGLPLSLVPDSDPVEEPLDGLPLALPDSEPLFDPEAEPLSDPLSVPLWLPEVEPLSLPEQMPEEEPLDDPLCGPPSSTTNGGKGCQIGGRTMIPCASGTDPASSTTLSVSLSPAISGIIEEEGPQPIATRQARVIMD
jgi:hypothetical protein